MEEIDVSDKLHGRETIQEEQRITRFKICSSCEYLTPNYFCSICNCWMPLKARLPMTKCPKDKWNK